MNNFLAMFKGMKNIFCRFTVSSLISILVTILTIYYIEDNVEPFNNLDLEIPRYIFSLIIAFFTSVGFYIFGESLGFSRTKNQLFQIIPVIFGILFYLFFNTNPSDFINIVFFLISLFCTISFLFFAPYVKNIFKKQEKEQERFFVYFSEILEVFITSTTVGIIFFILTSIGISTVSSLFDLDISYKIYTEILTVSFAFLGAMFGLNKIENKEFFEKLKFNENIFKLFLIKYIAIPFIFAYFVILYGYSVKVLLNFSDWPKGEISWLIIIFSALGYFIYITSYIYEEKISLVKTFRKYFPYVVFPQIFMLFYAIFLRIQQYSITTNRYLVVVFGIWLVIITLYLIISKRKYLAFIIFTLFISSSIISIGPWSVYSLPEKIQTNLLKEELKEIGILKDNGEIVPLKEYKEENIDLEKNISSKINYLCNFHSCEDLIKELNIKMNDLYKINNSNYIFAWHIEKYLNISTSNISTEIDNSEKEQEIERISYYDDKKETIKVQGYDYFSDLFTNNSPKNEISSINIVQKLLYLRENGKIIDEINIENILDKISDKEYIKNMERKNETISFEVEGSKVRVKIVFNTINLKTKNGKLYFDGYNEANLEGYILYSKK